MTYDQWKSEASPAVMFYEVEEETVQCELCQQDATCQVDLDPVTNPGRYMVDLCDGCATFERIRINNEIRNNTVPSWRKMVTLNTAKVNAPQDGVGGI